MFVLLSKMAPSAVDMAEAINYDAEQLYEKLLQAKQQIIRQGDSRQDQQDNSGGESSQKEDKSKQDVGHDTHSMWKQAVKKSKEQKETTGRFKRRNI